jgi:hypothetical protein
MGILSLDDENPHSIHMLPDGELLLYVLQFAWARGWNVVRDKHSNSQSARDDEIGGPFAF